MVDVSLTGPADTLTVEDMTADALVQEMAPNVAACMVD